MSFDSFPEARPSRPRSASPPTISAESEEPAEEGDDPRTDLSQPVATTSATQHVPGEGVEEGEEEGEEDRMDIKLIQGFAEFASSLLWHRTDHTLLDDLEVRSNIPHLERERLPVSRSRYLNEERRTSSL